jgi:hypothetical protein
MVQSCAPADSVELVHNALGSMDYRVSQGAGISCGVIRNLPSHCVGFTIGSCYEQSYKLLGVGRQGRLLRYALEQSAGLGITGFVLLAILRRLVREPMSDLRFSRVVYGVNFLLPLGFCLLNGYWIAIIAGVGTAAAPFLIFGLDRASGARLRNPGDCTPNPMLRSKGEVCRV